MAIQVQFEGYVREVKDYDWGTVYNVAHRQVIKNAAQEWETAGYDYFSVSREKGAPRFEVDAKVAVKGTLKSKTYPKRDGSGTGMALNVRAESFELAEAKSASVPEMQAVWPELKQVAADVPF